MMLEVLLILNDNHVAVGDSLSDVFFAFASPHTVVAHLKGNHQVTSYLRVEITINIILIVNADHLLNLLHQVLTWIVQWVEPVARHSIAIHDLKVVIEATASGELSKIHDFILLRPMLHVKLEKADLWITGDALDSILNEWRSNGEPGSLVETLQVFQAVPEGLLYDRVAVALP